NSRTWSPNSRTAWPNGSAAIAEDEEDDEEVAADEEVGAGATVCPLLPPLHVANNASTIPARRSPIPRPAFMY
ncbi:MAG: hypothetical protein WBR11_18990, partial [Terriglobales bacterium]